MEVALVDDSTGNIVDDGPEASARVEIVLLKGKPYASKGDGWTVEEFSENITPEVEGKKPLLAGNVPLKLQRGIGVLENVRFRHHASKIGLSKFKLGAKVVGAFGGHRIKEAKTGSLLSRISATNSSDYKKHETPSPSDDVSRLVNIRKGGKIDKRLQVQKVNTVEDFLIRLLTDPEALKTILNLYQKKWQATVKNARACVSDSTMYCYIKLEQKMGVVFNVLGLVLGLYIGSQYSATSILSENHKAYAQELLASAYKNWGNVKPFNGMNSLQHYFNDSHMDALDPFKPDYVSSGHENTGTSEMVGELSSWHSNNIHHAVCSTMNLNRETGRDYLDWLSTDNGGNVHSFG